MEPSPTGRGRPGGPWRVEWRSGARVEVVARLEQAYAHHSALDPVVARLQAEGRREGELRLVDEASDAVVARRRLDRPVRRRTAPKRRQGGRPAPRLNGPAPLAAEDRAG